MNETKYEFETITASAGSDFFAWGPTPGQVVLGTVQSFTATGGTDYDGLPCPEVQLTLLEPARSERRTGVTDYTAGATVTVTAGPAGLKRLLSSIDPVPVRGDVMRIEFDSMVKTPAGPMKHFIVQLARGAATVAPAAATGRASGTAAAATDEVAPF